MIKLQRVNIHYLSEGLSAQVNSPPSNIEFDETLRLVEVDGDLLIPLENVVSMRRLPPDMQREREKVLIDLARAELLSNEQMQTVLAALPDKRLDPNQCPDCGQHGYKNLGAHRAKAHGYKKP